MNLTTIQMPRTEARRAFLDYRSAVRKRHSDEDEAIMRGYRVLAQGKQIISLSRCIVEAGFEEKVWRPSWDQTSLRFTLLPRLAVARAHSLYAWTQGLQANGELSIQGLEWIDGRNRRDVIGFSSIRVPKEGASPAKFRAMAPVIPPALRPKGDLRNFHVLWEAEWELREVRPPGDPALLKHLGGDLYAVLAVWDLTDLERAVLAQTRRGGV